ncbi:hypothetical protein [uncultured Sphingomonas sp.]|uniref:hypothetical protein n=1 Tax=uncultured Sphingomonas sp. TaxID=158754 RepID=UPI0035CBD45D
MLPITTQQQFPTLLPDASPADRPAASAALGIIAFEGSQGSGSYKGGMTIEKADYGVIAEATMVTDGV